MVDVLNSSGDDEFSRAAESGDRPKITFNNVIVGVLTTLSERA